MKNRPNFELILYIFELAPNQAYPGIIYLLPPTILLPQGGPARVPAGGLYCPAGDPGPCDGLLPDTGRSPVLCQVQHAEKVHGPGAGYEVLDRHPI